MFHVSRIGYDSETDPIGPCQLAPPLICASWAWRDEQNNLNGALAGISDGDDELTRAIQFIFGLRDPAEPPVIRVAHNWRYDLAVLVASYPDYLSVVFEGLARGYYSCTKVREKLLRLANTGDLEYIVAPDGSKTKVEYSLRALMMHYFGIDRSFEKLDKSSWRTNFGLLKHLPVSQYPPDAASYAIQDSTDAMMIWEQQQMQATQIYQQTGIHPFQTEAFQVAVDFSLQLMSCWGIQVDPAFITKTEQMLAEELAPEKLNLLIDYGILQPSKPSAPHSLGHKNHVEGCPKKFITIGPDGEKQVRDCDCPVKMVAGEDEKINRAPLIAYVEQLAAMNPGIVLRKTAPSQKFPTGQISVDAEFLDDFAHLDPVLGQLQHRAALQKIVTTELPRMKWNGAPAGILHPCYDVLKETGRTSSYADDLYPSFNCQNVDPRVRDGYEARDGYYLFSSDYVQMELGTLAQRLLLLFGQSQLANLINARIDLHAFLAAQIALRMDSNFEQWVRSTNARTHHETYEMFLMFKESNTPGHQEFYDFYRTLAKPTGLGYPGGLMPETFIRYAKATYGLVIDLDRATSLREVWLATLPEMEGYFKWIKESCEDPRIPVRQVFDAKLQKTKQVKMYRYTSPFGMLRSGATYCACANGAGMQTPGAEGAKLAIFNVNRACYDPTVGGILQADERGYTTKPILFVHDQLLGEVRADEYAHDRCKQIEKLMVDAMMVVTPDVQSRVETVLTRRWNKKAKPVYDANGRLTLWEPKK